MKKNIYRMTISAFIMFVLPWIFFEMYEPAFSLYCGCYLIIGIVSMFISAYAKNRKR